MKQIPEVLQRKAEELEQYYETYAPALAPLAKPCFLNTIETTVKEQEDGTYFVITGDIEAMWLRDSSFQVMHYVRFAKESEELRSIIAGVIRRQAQQILSDPYANAFNEVPGRHGFEDKTEMNEWIWERKYELDSLCGPIYLAYAYWKQTGASDIFDEKYGQALKRALTVIRTEQHHEQSPYSFERFDCVPTDTLPCEGKGNPVGYTGMSWSGFRPSDDSCTYGYLIPSNMMAVKALGYVEEILRAEYIGKTDADQCWEELAEEAGKLRQEIQAGIEKYGVKEHPVYGPMYVYETDGLGHVLCMDDANSPSLLAMPYLSYCSKDDERYQNTRKFILSKENPYYFSGTAADGVGSPHTPDQYVWHIGIIMQALTSTDREEIEHCLKELETTHDGTYRMHESFHKDHPEQYTRSWFAWANSLFAELLIRLKEEKFLEKM